MFVPEPEQLRVLILLDLENPSYVVPLSLDGLTQIEDGLYEMEPVTGLGKGKYRFKKQLMNNQKKLFDFPVILLILSVLLVGTFSEYVSCFLTAAMVIYLCIRWRGSGSDGTGGGVRGKGVNSKGRKSAGTSSSGAGSGKLPWFRQNLTSVAIWVMIAFYLVSILWAIDPGEAWIGFMKYLPLGMFSLILLQKNREAWQSRQFEQNREARSDQPDQQTSQSLPGQELEPTQKARPTRHPRHYGLKERFFFILPYFAAITAAVSAILMQFDALKPYFSVSGRLSGFFQYPNTFACFILIAELVLVVRMITSKEKNHRLVIDLIVLAVLLAALVYSSSRTVLVLAFLSNLVLLLYLGNKRARVIVMIIAVLMAAAGVVFLLVRQGANPGDGSFSLAGSTLTDRLLYYADALPVILKHPFGLGYLGYYYLQGGFQTGVYSTMFVHNGFLQVFLDVGWIPGVLLIAAIVRSVLAHRLTVPEKIILCTFAVHIFFDFDLQFVSMFMILMLMMDRQSGYEWAAGEGQAAGKIETGGAAASAKTHKFGKELTGGKARTAEAKNRQSGKKSATGKKQNSGNSGTVALKILLALLGAVSLYMGAALLLSAFHANKPAQAMYPWNTENQLELLSNTTDPVEIRAISENILQYNKSSAAAWDSLAKTYYSEGDFGEVISCENNAMELGQFNHDYYADYLQMLVTGYQLYQQAGDESSAGICREVLLSVYDKFLTQPDRLSKLGKMIKDQPDTTLDAELTEMIKELQ